MEDVAAIIGDVISIHAPLTGSDASYINHSFSHRQFQSTLPLRGATAGSRPSWTIRQFQSTLPLRGATDDYCAGKGVQDISIHAPLTGSDWPTWTNSGRGSDFNPRSPYGERPMGFSFHAGKKNFNPRSPYGERLAKLAPDGWWQNFNPRSPYGERRRNLARRNKPFTISIHAPLTGSDLRPDAQVWDIDNFNPRSPYGERLYANGKRVAMQKFQSTLPLRGATEAELASVTDLPISIHAPLTGSDD